MYSRLNTRNSVPKSIEGQLKRQSQRVLFLDHWFPDHTVCACSVTCNCFVTPWAVACQAPLSVGFSISSSGDLPYSRIKSRSPVASALQAGSVLLSYEGSPVTPPYPKSRDLKAAAVAASDILHFSQNHKTGD